MKNTGSNTKITPSREDYLKVLLELTGEDGARSVDVADALGITKASVSCMMNRLKEEGYITKEKYGSVTLTDKGIREASDVRRRYYLLKAFLTQVLGVDAQTASEDACRIEHIISSESIARMDAQLRHVQNGGPDK